MVDFHTLAELSRTHCISICAFLVPANLIATAITILFTVLRRPIVQVWQITAIATLFAVLMLLHVFTWFTAGVVMIPTYVLLWLATTCLIANYASIFVAKRLGGKTSTCRHALNM